MVQVYASAGGAHGLTVEEVAYDVRSPSYGMQLIPPGDVERSDDNLPNLSIERGFYIGTSVVTEDFWKSIMGSVPDLSGSGDNFPVVGVSYDDVEKFLNELNSKEPFNTLTDRPFRLLTEEEWEYACRLDTDGEDLDNIAWHRDNSGREVQEVGTKSPGNFYLNDMLGNVWEWTSSLLDESGHVPRVVRGGSWDLRAQDVRAACRCWYDRDFRYGLLGFRLARDA